MQTIAVYVVNTGSGLKNTCVTALLFVSRKSSCKPASTPNALKAVQGHQEPGLAENGADLYGLKKGLFGSTFSH